MFVSAAIEKAAVSERGLCRAGLKREWLIGQQLNNLSKDNKDIPGTLPSSHACTVTHLLLRSLGDLSGRSVIMTLPPHLPMLCVVVHWSFIHESHPLQPVSPLCTMASGLAGSVQIGYACCVPAGFMFTGAALVSGAGGGNAGMLEGLVIEKLNGWDIEKR